jgi:adenylate kinase
LSESSKWNALERDSKAIAKRFKSDAKRRKSDYKAVERLERIESDRKRLGYRKNDGKEPQKTAVVL